MDTLFPGIWPTRTVPLVLNWTDTTESVADDLRESVLAALDGAGLNDLLSCGVTLDDNVRMIALAVLGVDPISDGQLLLRVNCELHGGGMERRFLLRLAVLPYPGSNGGDAIFTAPMMPENAADILNLLITKIKELAPERILVEHELRD